MQNAEMEESESGGQMVVEMWGRDRMTVVARSSPSISSDNVEAWICAEFVGGMRMRRNGEWE